MVKPSTQILNNFHVNHFPLQCSKENLVFIQVNQEIYSFTKKKELQCKSLESSKLISHASKTCLFVS